MRVAFRVEFPMAREWRPRRFASREREISRYNYYPRYEMDTRIESNGARARALKILRKYEPSKCIAPGLSSISQSASQKFH